MSEARSASSTDRPQLLAPKMAVGRAGNARRSL
jgi:hypothetical protein